MLSLNYSRTAEIPVIRYCTANTVHVYLPTRYNHFIYIFWAMCQCRTWQWLPWIPPCSREIILIRTQMEEKSSRIGGQYTDNRLLQDFHTRKATLIRVRSGYPQQTNKRIPLGTTFGHLGLWPANDGFGRGTLGPERRWAGRCLR